MNHFLEIQKWTYAQILEPILALRGREAESTEGVRYAPTPTLPHTYCDDDKLDSAGLMWSQWATWPRGQCVCQTKIYILNEGFPHKWVKTTNLTLLNDFSLLHKSRKLSGLKNYKHCNTHCKTHSVVDAVIISMRAHITVWCLWLRGKMHCG